MRYAHAALAALVLAAACSSVDSTEHCVQTRYGNPIDLHVSPGMTNTMFSSLECFPITQQTWPGGKDDAGQANVEHVSFLTRDSVTIDSAEIALTYNYVDVPSAFKIKRYHEQVMIELQNAVRSGIRDFGATITLPDLLGPKRAELDRIAKAAIQNHMGPYVQIDEVYLRHLEPPAAIKAIWQTTMQQQGMQAQARAKYVTDSLSAKTTVMQAEASARVTELSNRAMASNPEVLRLNRDKAIAEASAQLLSNCTSNCFIGGDAFTKSLLQRTNP